MSNNNNNNNSHQSKTTTTAIVKPPEPWVSKYRPKSVDEVAYQEDVVNALKRSLETGNLPHLLFYGPPGTGKTSAILAVANDLYGPEFIKDRVLELNASDERGIDVVRNKIKSFASFTVNQVVSTNGKVTPGFKLIILDEADSMTHDAQAALRRTIENSSKTTRFCLLCNYITRIIEPLSSRCAKFRFKPLNNEAMLERLQFICEKEGVKCDSNTLSAIQHVSDGDMRKAITYLQSSYRFYGNKLNQDSIYNISGSLPPKLIQDFINTCKSNSYDKLQAMVQKIISMGYSTSQTLSQLFDYIVANRNESSNSLFNDQQLSEITIKLGQVDKNLLDGSEEFLQLFDVASFIMNQFVNNNNNNKNKYQSMQLD